jgi:orotate phosphoribosyltransferase
VPVHGKSLAPILREFGKKLEKPELSTERFAGALLRLQAAVGNDLENGSIEEFGHAWILHAIATDLLRYSIEDDYIQIDPSLLHETAGALRTLAVNRAINWSQLTHALTLLRQVAATPAIQAQMVEVRPNPDNDSCSFLALLAPSEKPGIPVSSQARPLVPILEHSLSRPKYARCLVDAFSHRLRNLRKQTGFSALCFVEKTAGPVGALALHAALVDSLGIPACIYRDNYWVGRARLTGMHPAPNERVAIVYDLCVTGDGIKHVAAGLNRLGIHTVGAAVLAGFERRDAVRVDQQDVAVEALLWLDSIDHDIRTAQATGKNTRHLTFLSSHGGSDYGAPADLKETRSAPPLNGGTVMSEGHPGWQSNLFAYQELSGIAFANEDEFTKGADRIFSSPALRGMPADVVGNWTLIVPSIAVSHFEGLKFENQEVGSVNDLSEEEIAELRREQGHH